MSDCALYCVRIEIWRMPEFTQFDSTKSTMRNLPPKGVAGLQRCSVSALRRSPRPPAMMTASVPPVRRLTYRPEDARAGCRGMVRRGTRRPLVSGNVVYTGDQRPVNGAHRRITAISGGQARTGDAAARARDKCAL